MIVRDASTENSGLSVDINQDLNSDYEIGGVYESYERREGSGIFFYLITVENCASDS